MFQLHFTTEKPVLQM